MFIEHDIAWCSMEISSEFLPSSLLFQNVKLQQDQSQLHSILQSDIPFN